MINSDSALGMFQSISGTSASGLSVIIKTVIYVSFFLWAAYNLYLTYKLAIQGDILIDNFTSLLRCLLICTIVLILIS